MKNFKLVVLLVFSAVLTLAACKKDDKEDDKDKDPIVTQKTYLTKLTDGDGDYSKWTYNASNQVIKIEITDSGSTTPEGIINLTYSDKKLTKLEYLENGTVELKLVFLNHNTDNLPVKADFYNDQGAGLIKSGYYEYNFTGKKIDKISLYGEVLSQTIEISRIEYTYSGDNVATAKIYEFGITSVELENITDYEYDNKTSPILVTELFQFLNGDLFDGLNFNSVNNISKTTEKDKNGAVQNDESSTTAYEYNSDNLPTKATITFGSGSTSVLTYEYIKK